MIKVMNEQGVYHLKFDGKDVWLFRREVEELIDILKAEING